jgi:hypothetical protein
MKLRLYGDSVRVRLSRSEMDRLGQGDAVESITRFSAHHALECRVELSETNSMRADFIQRATGTLLIVALPKSNAIIWAGNAEEGLYGEQPNGTGGILSIAVEKDFECLHSDDAAENQDAFPNPREAS